MEGWKGFIDRCARHDLLPIDVPGDGNCLVWSLRLLERGREYVEGAGRALADEEQFQLRDAIKQMWLDVQGDQVWQMVFSCLGGDYLSDDKVVKQEVNVKVEKFPTTPIKRSPPEFDGVVGNSIGKRAQGVKVEVKHPPKTPIKKRPLDLGIVDLCSVKDGVKIEVPPATFSKKARHWGVVDLCSTEHEVKIKEPLKTPPKRRSGFDGFVDLSTPPRPEPPQKKGRNVVWGAGGGKPAPFSMKEEPVEKPSDLKGPGHCDSKMQSFLENEVPDLQGLFHQVHMGTEVSKPPEPRLEELDDEMLGPHPKGRRRREHERRFLRKQWTDAETTALVVSSWMASLGFDYQSFSAAHRRAASVKKAAVCTDGGWLRFKFLWQNGGGHKCEVCSKLCETYGLSHEGLERYRKETPASKGCEDDKGQKAENPPAEGGHVELDVEKTEFEKSVEYVKSFSSVVTLIEDDGLLKYRCHICKSVRQPEGKVNRLGKGILKDVKFFLGQHFQCSTHIANLKRISEASNPVSEKKKCEGYCISDPRSPGVLKDYLEEYKLWVSHSPLQSATGTKHSHTCDLTKGQYQVRHGDCELEFDYEKSSANESLDEPLCCPRCASLGDRSRIAKVVVRFALKYYAAILLRQRLFASKEEALETAKQISETYFGQKHKVQWGKITVLKNVELQKMVREAWTHSALSEQTSASKAFFSTVVDPCLKVHPSSVHSNVASVSDQFLKALVSNNGSDPSLMYIKVL